MLALAGGNSAARAIGSAAQHRVPVGAVDRELVAIAGPDPGDASPTRCRGVHG